MMQSASDATVPEFLIDHWDFTHTPARQRQDAPDTIVGHWVHCQRDAEGLDDWLNGLGISPALRQALLATDTRPRFEAVPEGFLLNLRGVNLTPGAQPDDMLSLRFLWHRDGLITLRRFSFKAITSVREKLKRQQGPSTLATLVVVVIEALNVRIDELLEAQERELEELEAADFGSHPQQHMANLTQLHKRLLRLHRFIQPQVGALDRFTVEADTWLAQRDMQILSNQRDATLRILETTDMLLQQVQLVRDELQQNVAERMNRNTYTLSLVAGIFLPLGFLTGLFGINVGGMPGVDNDLAFWIVCAGMGVVALGDYLLLRRMRFW